MRSKDDTRRSVLRYVRMAAPCSRAEIAAATGLTKATISTIVTELVNRRMLREIGAGGRRIGRPASLLMMDGSGYVGIGVRICPGHLIAVAVDLADRRQFTWRRAFRGGDASPRQVIAETARLVGRAAARIQAAGGSVVGLAVAVPGPVDSTGVVHGLPALGWPHVELRADLVRALDRPTYPIDVDNDATLGAIAEHRYGAFAGTPHLAYLAGTHTGGVGLIHGGVPLRGANGYGGTFADLDAIVGASGGPREIELQRLVRQARAGEPDTVARLAEVGARLGRAVAVLVDLLNPTAVLLGGDHARLAPWVLAAAERECRDRAVTPNADALKLAVSTLGYEAPALGAAVLPLNVIERT